MIGWSKSPATRDDACLPKTWPCSKYLLRRHADQPAGTPIALRDRLTSIQTAGYGYWEKDTWRGV